jgi:uncharacterized protein with GYD domain
MPTYITLFRWTQDGIEQVKDSPARLDQAKQLFQQFGGQVKSFYIVLGHYDAVLVSEAPDDETAARIALAVAAQGKIRSETLRAFTETEYRQLIATLP